MCVFAGVFIFYFFFFSSRRRHTRFDCDWSSDVCASDLRAKKVLELAMSEARELNHSYVGTEHLLLGLLREEKGIAAQVLTDALLLAQQPEQARAETRSEEHTSELQSQSNLVCRLLLEKKKKQTKH